VYTTTTHTYADILKQQFSLAPNSMLTTTTSSKPPCKQQATLLDYDSDQLTEFTSTPTTNPSTGTGTTTNNPTTPVTPIPVFATELMSLKNELTQLKEVIATAVMWIKDAITALLDTNQTTTSYDTTTDADQTMDSAPAADQLTPLNIQSFITDLKHKLATLFLETHAMIQQQSLPTPTTKHLPSKT